MIAALADLKGVGGNTTLAPHFTGSRAAIDVTMGRSSMPARQDPLLLGASSAVALTTPSAPAD